MNNKGNFLIGILFVAMGIIVLMAISPAIEEMAVDLKDNSTFNCEGTGEYNSALDTNTFGCTIADLITPLLILGVIISGIVIIYYGKKDQYEAPQSYPSYQTGY